MVPRTSPSEEIATAAGGAPADRRQRYPSSQQNVKPTPESRPRRDRRLAPSRGPAARSRATRLKSMHAELDAERHPVAYHRVAAAAGDPSPAASRSPRRLLARPETRAPEDQTTDRDHPRPRSAAPRRAPDAKRIHGRDGLHAVSTTALLVLLDHQHGEARALVGNFDFWDAEHGGQIVGFDTPRSPGSALKPFIYALAVDQRPGPAVRAPGARHPDLAYGDYSPAELRRPTSLV